MKHGRPAFVFKKYPYESSFIEITPVQLEVTLFDHDLDINGLLEEFQLFLVGAGYNFKQNQRLGVITDE